MRKDVSVTGELPAGRFIFEPALRDPHGGRLDTTFYQFDKVRARGVAFDVDEVRIHISESEFDGCVFRQDAHITKANKRQFAHSFSTVRLGLERRSVYRDCTFDHVDFGIAGGGCHPGDARFERCTFNYCAFRQFEAKQADFVECTFIGTMTSARFWGRSESAAGGSRHNTFDRNDLTRAKLRRVEFLGVDLRTSSLPDGPEYLRVDDFLAKAPQARTAMSTWPGAERKKAEWLLGLYEERWSEPLFCWRKALADADSRLWPLLESL